MAGAESTLETTEPLEIISLNGTLSLTGCHLHISVSKKSGEVIGGHLLDGCLVETTAEVVLTNLHSYTFTREVDPTTGFLELIVKDNQQTQ
jgi:predicted DNA-binding protein with PD1-like motif